MTLTTLSSDIAIIWFWAGIFAILCMAHVYRRTVRAVRRAIRLRADLDAALAARRSEIRRMYPLDNELARICRSAEAAMSTEEAFAAEADLDLWIYRRQEAESQADERSRSDPASLAAATSDIRAFRDRYNEAASIVAARRRSLPGALIARSLIDEDLPLLPDLESV